MNALHVDCACVGNHDFDFGYPHLTKLLSSTHFPWLLSNIVDETTGKTPEGLHELQVVERCGVRVGIVGLVEQDWIATIPSWPKNFVYRPMKETALDLSRRLRDPAGPHRVDIIIALTHCRVPNDIALANQLGAVAGKHDEENEHGVDLLIGGHDHIGKGAASWDGFPGERDVQGTEEDQGVRLIKSGTDFRDLTSASLILSPPTDGIRRRTITSLTGKHHYILPSSPSSKSFEQLLSTLLSSVSDTLGKPVCFTLTPFDARSQMVRSRETGLGNWVADVLMHAYAESLIEDKDFFEKDRKDGNISRAEREEREGKGSADAVIICGGTLRGDSQYGPGKITLGDILEIMPFEDPVVCLELDGKGIWDTLESALSKWPAQEGRFPIIAGLAVEWDHTRPPNQRVKSIHLTVPHREHDEIEDPTSFVDFVEQDDGTRIEIKQRGLERGDEVENKAGGRVYRIITREYMAGGYDGFQALRGRKHIIDDETGQIMSAVIRSFLLGSSYIFRHKQLFDYHQSHLSSRTQKVLERARQQHHSPVSSLTSSPERSVHARLPSDATSSTQTVGPPVRVKTLSSEGSYFGDSAGAYRSPGLVDRSIFGDGAVRSNSTDQTCTNEPSTYGIRRDHPHVLHALEQALSPDSERSGATTRRHVVEHDWRTIRDALHVARHEHMSPVDSFKGHEIRRQTTRDAKAMEDKEKRDGFLVDSTRRAELKALAMDVAIVCPLVDGRLKDLAA
ncbi:hypothetical protein Q5752_004321 [Cryptotrichosporon argae]